ncbi:glycosyltransferase [Bacteroides fragilis]|nr:glycosyltransferase [Bacteroides fragilis]
MTRVLIVARCNAGKFSPFVVEQVDSLRKIGIEIDFFGITENGILGYLKHRKNMMCKISDFQPDIIHAHYGLSGLLANMQRKVPVITTFHGSDINLRQVRWLSRIAIKFSIHSVFVGKKMVVLVHPSTSYSIIPCGVDINRFFPMDKNVARKKLGWNYHKKMILFAGAFQNRVKNYTLAHEGICLIDEEVELMELKGYDRDTVNLLLNACDLVLLTSIREGSPQIIKEAMACGRPVVCTDVGDIKSLSVGVNGHYITSFTATDVARNIKQALTYGEQHSQTNGREHLLNLQLDLPSIAIRLNELYVKYGN